MRTYTWNGSTHKIGAPHLSDVEVAGQVRMLMRDQLNHEKVCTDARDRIMCLVEEKEKLIRILRQHHEWHQQEGLEMKLGDEFFDCASAYCDSTLEEQTTAALIGR